MPLSGAKAFGGNRGPSLGKNKNTSLRMTIYDRKVVDRTGQKNSPLCLCASVVSSHFRHGHELKLIFVAPNQLVGRFDRMCAVGTHLLVAAIMQKDNVAAIA